MKRLGAIEAGFGSQTGASGATGAWDLIALGAVPGLKVKSLPAAVRTRARAPPPSAPNLETRGSLARELCSRGNSGWQEADWPERGIPWRSPRVFSGTCCNTRAEAL